MRLLTFETVIVGLVLPDELKLLVLGRSVLAPVMAVQFILLYEVVTDGAAATALVAVPIPSTTVPDGSDAPVVNATIKADVPDVCIFVSMTVTWLMVELEANTFGMPTMLASTIETTITSVHTLKIARGGVSRFFPIKSNHNYILQVFSCQLSPRRRADTFQESNLNIS